MPETIAATPHSSAAEPEASSLPQNSAAKPSDPNSSAMACRHDGFSSPSSTDSPNSPIATMGRFTSPATPEATCCIPQNSRL